MASVHDFIEVLKNHNYRINVMFEKDWIESSKFFSFLLRNDNYFTPGRDKKALMFGYDYENILVWNFRTQESFFSEIGGLGTFLDLFSPTPSKIMYEISDNKYNCVNNYINFIASDGYFYELGKQKKIFVYNIHESMPSLFQISIKRKCLSNKCLVEKYPYISATTKEKEIVDELYTFIKENIYIFEKEMGLYEEENPNLHDWSKEGFARASLDLIKSEEKRQQAAIDTIIKIFDKEIRKSPKFRKELWSALANVTWYNVDDPNQNFSFGYRSAGGLIAEYSGVGTYLTYYMSGEVAHVSKRIEKAMQAIGWSYKLDDDEKSIQEEKQETKEERLEKNSA